MADFASGGATRFKEYGVDTSTSLATTITAGTSYAKGSYVELTSSTDFDAQGIIVCIGKADASSRYLVDVAIGGSGSETVIIPDLIARAHGNKQIVAQMFFPVSIPAGTRISARCSAFTNSSTIRISVILVGGGFSNYPVYSGVEAIGLQGDVDGTYYQTSGTAANTKSPWQEMKSSVDHDIKAVLLAHTHYAGYLVPSFVYDIGIGAGGSEQVLIPNIVSPMDVDMNSYTSYCGPLPCSIPAGTRVAARAQTQTPNSVNYWVIMLYGLY